jgi:hypothetical protein
MGHLLDSRRRLQQLERCLDIQRIRHQHRRCDPEPTQSFVGHGGYTGPARAAAPILLAGDTAFYMESAAAVTSDPAVTVSDPGSTILTGATIAITGRLLAGGTLNFTNEADVAGSYNSATGVLTPNVTSSLAAQETAVDSITHSPSNADPTHGRVDLACTVTWTVASGTTTSMPITSRIEIGNNIISGPVQGPLTLTSADNPLLITPTGSVASTTSGADWLTLSEVTIATLKAHLADFKFT